MERAISFFREVETNWVASKRYTPSIRAHRKSDSGIQGSSFLKLPVILVWTVWMISGAGVNSVMLVWTVWVISKGGVTSMMLMWTVLMMGDAGVNCADDQWLWCELNDAGVNCVDDQWCWCELCWQNYFCIVPVFVRNHLPIFM